MPIVRFRKVRDRAQAPEYQTWGAAGADLRACLDEPVTLRMGDRALVPTGLALELPIGYEAQIRPRSGWAKKCGVTVLNAPGTIDPDYRGEVGVLLVNLGDMPVTIADGDRIAQLVVSEFCMGRFEEAEELGETERGEAGFGSTGS